MKSCHLPILCLSGLLLTAACGSGDKKGAAPTPSGYVDEDTTYITLEEAEGDSLLVGSVGYSDAARALESLQQRVATIQSPDMLLSMLDEYSTLHKTAEAKAAMVENPDERARLQSTLAEIDAAFDSVSTANKLSAQVVIENLRNVQHRLNNCRTRAELLRMTDVRHAFFQHLGSLHKIVWESQRQREVHHLAMEVQNTLQRKQAQFGVE